MDDGPDNFAALRRLLALKRHEQPPPGYFDRFPDLVLARLEAGAALRSLPWWQRWLEDAGLRPALVGAFGLALCAVYYFGVGLAKYVEHQSAQAMPVAPLTLELWHVGAQARHSDPFLAPGIPPLANSFQPTMVSSMSPLYLAGPARSLLAPGAGLHVERASYSVPVGGH